MEQIAPFKFWVNADVRFEPSEHCFVARCEEYPDCQGLSVDPFRALEQLSLAIRDYLKMCENSRQFGNIG